MTQELLTKESVQRLLQIQGECRGMNVKTDWDFILRTEGKEGLKKLEAKMAEVGYPLRHEQISSVDFYPVGLDAVSMLAIKETFNYDDQAMERLGEIAVSFSLITKIFIKYFVSLHSFAEELPKMWPKYYTVGELTMDEYDRTKRYVVLRLKNFKLHPIYCTVFKGFFGKVASMVIGASVVCQETKCMFRGDEYHEYLITWK